MSLNKLIYLLLFIILGTNLSTSIYYLLFLLASLISGIIFLRKMKLPFYTKEDYIALSFIVVWAYGILLGIIRGNNIVYVVSNFAGMLCYMFYFYLTTIRPNIKIISTIVISSGILLALFSLVRLIVYILGVSLPLIDTGVGISSTGQLRVYFTTLCVSYCALGVSFISVINKTFVPHTSVFRSKIFSLLIFTLTSASIFFVASSKGFLLGGVAILFVIVISLYFDRILKGKLSVGFIPFIILSIILVGFLFYLDYFSIIENMFSATDSSNEIRYEQLTFLMKDIDILGKGLGAVVPGVIRSEEGPYGFELTYINLIHKFGVFSLVLFFNWIYMFYSLYKIIAKRRNIYYAIIAMSGLGYLFPSIGNPLLMHPSLVILNAISLYYIRVLNHEKNISLYGRL